MDTDVPPSPPPSPSESGAGELSDRFAALVAENGWQVDTPDPSAVGQPVEPLPEPESTPSPADNRGHEARRVATEDEASPPSPEQLIEAMLFTGGPPLTPERACEVIRGLTPDQFRAVIEGLNGRYRVQDRPYAVVRSERGYALALKGHFRGVREKLFGGPRETRLSQPALDVLALVAYRQPISRAEMDSLRGADSAALLRQLVRLALVAVIQRGDAGSQAISYGTTPRFLEVFGLRSLDDLPRTGDPQRM